MPGFARCRAQVLGRPPDRHTLGEYIATWTERLLDVEIEGIVLEDWLMRELRRRHALVLVDHMLTNEGRATTGALGILQSLSAMAEDAITDEVCKLNPLEGIRIRANNRRAQKERRPIHVFSFEEIHRFAKAAGRYEALVRTSTDTGVRLGTKTDHGEEDAGRVIPVPAI